MSDCQHERTSSAHQRVRLVWSALAVGALGFGLASCQGALGGKDDLGNLSPEEVAENYEEIFAQCDLPAVLAKPENNCTGSGCHGERFQGNLDLLSEGVDERLVDVPSDTDACAGERLIDSEDPENSLLLKLVDADLHEEGETCGQLMPLGSDKGVTGEDLTCMRAWVYYAANNTNQGPTRFEEEFEPEPILSAANKVKNLTTGGALSAQELESLSGGTPALRTMLSDWVEQPGFRVKMHEFFKVALQQRFEGDLNDQLSQVYGTKEKTDTFEASLGESFARTAWTIVDRGDPFNTVVTTNKWQLTTALMSALLMSDWTTDELRDEDHTYFGEPGPGDPSLPLSLSQSAKLKAWHVASLPGDCKPEDRLRAEEIFRFMLGYVPCDGPTRAYRWDGSPLSTNDLSDWREVTLKQGNTSELFYDLPAIRSSKELTLKIPRVGFFTTTAFLGNWATNEDNQFRVTTSQTLLTALGSGFFSSDPTPDITDSGLDAEHSDTGTTCYGCHRLLDPMRNYFAEVMSARYRSPESTPGHAPAFGYRGETFDGGTLVDFAQQVANHPQFAVGWTQRLCQYANSQSCDVADPEFQRVVGAFEDSNFDFKTLVIELFSSPLVTGESYVDTYGTRYFLYSITRQQHLCALLDERLDSEDVCSEGGSFIGLIPDDEFSRGEPKLVQTPSTGPLHFAAVERLCERLSFRLVGNQADKLFPVDDEDATINDLVTRVMGLSPGHPRRDGAIAELKAHWQAAQDAGANRPIAMKSVFTLACMSPDVMGMGL